MRYFTFQAQVGTAKSRFEGNTQGTWPGRTLDLVRPAASFRTDPDTPIFIPQQNRRLLSPELDEVRHVRIGQALCSHDKFPICERVMDSVCANHSVVKLAHTFRAKTEVYHAGRRTDLPETVFVAE